MRLAQRQANMMRLQAAMHAGRIGKPRFGTITSYDPDEHAIKVMIQPEEIETGWCTVLVALAGTGWGVYFGPAIGDQAVLLFQENDHEVGWCVGYLPNDEDRPPRVLSGEIFMIHKTGSYVKLKEDGKVYSKGEWLHDGDFKATGDILDRSGSNTATVEMLRDAHNGHNHSGVQTGGGSSGGPNLTAP